MFLGIFKVQPMDRNQCPSVILMILFFPVKDI